MDEFDFDLNQKEHHLERTSLSQTNSRTSNVSSVLRSGLGKTKAARRKRKLEQKHEEIDKSVRFSFEEEEEASSTSMKALSSKTASPLSSSVSSTSSSARNLKRRKRAYGVASKRGITHQDLSSSRSSSRSSSPTRRGLSRPSFSSSSTTSIRSSLSSRKSQDVDADDDDDDDDNGDDDADVVNEPVVVVKGAGLNVMAVQDAGAHRMLLDEFTYLLSTIRTTTSSKSNNNVGTAKEDNNTTLLWDLALLLSKPKNRSILWTYAQDTALPSILNLVGSIPSPAGGEQEEPDLSASVEGEDSGQNSVRSSQRPSDASSMSSSQPNEGCDPTKDARRAAPQKLQSLSLSGYEALAAIVYFVSLDCTAANSTASAARKMRRTILRHDTAVRGTSHLLLLQEIAPTPTAGIPTPNNIDAETPIVDGSPPNIADTTNTPASTSECSSLVSLSTMESHPPTRKKSDPTSSGRRKRRNKKKQTKIIEVISLLDPIAEDQSPCQEKNGPKRRESSKEVEAERLSFTGSSSRHDEDTLVKRNKNATSTPQGAPALALSSRLAEKVRSKIKWNSTNSACGCHDSTTAVGGNLMFVKRVVLEALNRIIQGKEVGDETSCLDGEDDESEDDDEESSNEPNKENNNVDMTSDDDMAKIEASNPLMVTNKLLFESEALPIFATVMARVLRESLVPNSRKADHTCQSHLLYQISGLATLLDGACLLNDDNREELCADGKLISSLTQVLMAASKMSDSSSGGAPSTNPMLLEIALISVRTLTSLTHENALAGQQLRSSVLTGDGTGDDWGGQGDQFSTTNATSGIEILLAVLYRMITDWNSTSKKDGNDDASKQRYDMIVFCLNTLTNVVETAQIQSVLSSYLVPSTRGAAHDDNRSKKNESFLVWLTRWVVGETSSFRNDVLNGSFGKKGEQQEVRKESYLHKDAEEHLVTAGNGFILLACIMVHGENSASESILEQTPGGFKLIINTLKSFCNFYYYSVGDLSVAVVAPVKKLIIDLEETVRKHHP